VINETGLLAVLDHHIALNWDDGPTLMRIAASVDYLPAAFSSNKTLTVNANFRVSDEPLCLQNMADGLRSTWTWREAAPGFACGISIANEGDDTVYLNRVDLMRIDARQGGQLNLGAPASLWRVSSAETRNPEWQVIDAIDGSGIDAACVLQPVASSRSTPPCLYFRRLDGDGPAMRFRFALDGDKLGRFAASCEFASQPLAPGISIALPEVFIASGPSAEALIAISHT
jgi:hypothetical protein